VPFETIHIHYSNYRRLKKCNYEKPTDDQCLVSRFSIFFASRFRSITAKMVPLSMKPKSRRRIFFVDHFPESMGKMTSVSSQCLILIRFEIAGKSLCAVHAGRFRFPVFSSSIFKQKHQAPAHTAAHDAAFQYGSNSKTSRRRWREMTLTDWRVKLSSPP